ncbi:hypothetical protein L1987_06884 [Smallanthus sonchifolius]|uniref:Uncharacterized protein n=1 Tax=Smallanthus sonchifolius TaxID=185202 RepID=A0ACB9JZJ7_9ASTR|nr:hypothetical protein L1987_06884 [Smallanthus sonchifolius]
MGLPGSRWKVWKLNGDAWQAMKSYPADMMTGIPLRYSGRRGGGRTSGRNRTPARQEYNEEGGVYTEPEVNMHGTERTLVEEQHFTFEPEVKTALAREFTELMKATLLDLLAEALKKANEAGGSNMATDASIIEAVNAPPARGCDYKSFKACDPPVLTVKKDAVATFD